MLSGVLYIHGALASAALYICSLFLFSTHAPSIAFLYSHPTLCAPYMCSSLQVLLCTSIPSPCSHSCPFLFCIRSLACFNFWGPAIAGHLGFLGDILPCLIFIIFLSIWLFGDNSSRYSSLGLSYLSGYFIPELLFALCKFRECWLSVAPYSVLFGGYVQEGMLANVESWEK